MRMPDLVAGLMYSWWIRDVEKEKALRYEKDVEGMLRAEGDTMVYSWPFIHGIKKKYVVGDAKSKA